MENKLHQEQEKVHLAEEKDSKAKRERDALEKSRAKVVKFESALVELGGWELVPALSPSRARDRAVPRLLDILGRTCSASLHCCA